VNARVTGVIQAGGRSTRMGGEPKALLDLGGRRIIDRVVDALSAVLPDLLVVTNTPDAYAFLGLPMTPDALPDSGSLGGIYSGLRAVQGDAIFTVACDMPFLTPAAIRLILQHARDADVVIPRVGDQLETLHALYGLGCLAPMEARITAGKLKITGFFPDVRVLEIPEAEISRVADPSVIFMNVNTPDELARARALVART
jgi:molybdopterin-guanine dinucleotide biosynthesis protein A